MSEKLVDFLIKNPWMIYIAFAVVVIVVVVLFIILVRVILKGGKITTPWVAIEQPSRPAETQKELQERVSQKVKDVKQGGENQVAVAYNPPPLPEQVELICAARYDIKSRVMKKSLEFGGSWPGVSLASFETFLDNARMGNILSPSLIQDIQDYLSYTEDLHLFANNSFMFEQAQYLAASLVLRLEHGEDVNKYWRA